MRPYLSPVFPKEHGILIGLSESNENSTVPRTWLAFEYLTKASAHLRPTHTWFLTTNTNTNRSDDSVSKWDTLVHKRTYARVTVTKIQYFLSRRTFKRKVRTESHVFPSASRKYSPRKERWTWYTGWAKSPCSR